jgi:putative toxin-antitoxin system antitoxin component (TIGR02293 family)
MGIDRAFLSSIGATAESDFELALLTESGFPLASVDALRRQGLTSSEIAEIIIRPRTLKHRKLRDAGLSRAESERALRTARILALADKTFGAHENAMGWLRETDDRLDNRTALQMLTTEAGGRLIENMLGQIDEGIFA